MFLIEHPEIAMHISTWQFFDLVVFTTTPHFAYLQDNIFIFMDNIFNVFINCIYIIYFSFFIKFFFFSYFFNFKDKSSIDTVNLTTSLLTECEKEIASIDDLIPLFIFVLYTFGCYFYIYSMLQFIKTINSIVFIFVLIPFFFMFIYIVPLSLLFDFGIFLFLYIRGAGPTSLLAAELLYDVINLFAFYIRVLIQLARIMLMFIAAGSLQEYIYYFGINSNILIFNENLVDSFMSTAITTNNITFFFFYQIPITIIY